MGKRRALVVEDDPEIRRMLVSMLEARGFQAEQALDLLGAFTAWRHSRAKAEPYALVVTDNGLPNLPGEGPRPNAEQVAGLFSSERVAVFSGDVPPEGWPILMRPWVRKPYVAQLTAWVDQQVAELDAESEAVARG